MRHLIWVCALASSASVASGQVPDTVPRRAPALRALADSGGLQIPPDCVHSVGGSPSARSADSLCLTRREAIDSALARNPQLRAGVEQVAQARARKVQGTAIPDPAFSYEYSEATGLFGSGQTKDKVVSASLTIPFPDKFRLQNRIGRADVRSTEASLASLRQIVAAQTSQSYDSLLAVLRRRRSLETAKQLADDFLQKTEARFQGGSTPRLDVIRARVQVAQAQNDLIASERDIANARAALNRLIDRPLGAPIAVSDSLALPPPLPPLDVLETAALTSRPELAGAQRLQEGARATTTLAREYWLPDLSFGVVHNYADPGPGVLFTGLSMPLPLFFWQHTRGEIAESRHRELELAASYRDLQAEIGQDVRAAYTTAATALRQTIYIRDVLLPASREAYRIASVSYGLGGSSALEVLEARRELQDAENQYTDALVAANMARSDLERAVGAPLEQLGTGGSRDD
jgi:cobalt-zinc-cadmium efflux system outer membrane protein